MELYIPSTMITSAGEGGVAIRKREISSVLQRSIFF